MTLNLLGFVDSKLDTLRPGDSLGAQRILLSTVTLLPTIAVGLKRLHDRDRSGWFFVLILVPLLNLWIVFEMRLLKGTVGA